jgi:hypothetical protein
MNAAADANAVRSNNVRFIFASPVQSMDARA